MRAIQAALFCSLSAGNANLKVMRAGLEFEVFKAI
jgi:hypothetical protein